MGHPPEDAAHAGDADAACEESCSLDLRGHDEGTVRPLDLDVTAYRERGQGILELGLPQTGGELQPGLRGSIRVREVMLVRLHGVWTGERDDEPLARLEVVVLGALETERDDVGYPGYLPDEPGRVRALHCGAT